MLVLSRKCEESVIIAGNIVVTILGIEGERVKIGIEAPRDVTIMRQEVIDRALRQSDTAVNDEPPLAPEESKVATGTLSLVSGPT